jgi:hypothetical protein
LEPRESVTRLTGTRLGAVVAAAALLFGTFTTYEHMTARGKAYFEKGGNQQTFDQAVLDGHGGSPYQYRLLTPYVSELARRSFEALGVEDYVLVSFVVLRVLADVAIFLLAFPYFRALGLPASHAFIGMSLLAWGMSHSHLDSSLHLDTYLEISLYLLTGLCILRERYVWVVPIALVGALNRETSGLIPVLLLAGFVYRSGSKPSFALTRSEWALVAAAFGAYFAVFIGLRLAFGEQPMAIPYGHPPGLDLFQYNALRVTTWMQLFATLGILPVLALAGYRRWPQKLRLFAWVVVPVWVVVHLFGAVLAEARLMLVPQALVFVPGALFLVRGDSAGTR